MIILIYCVTQNNVIGNSQLNSLVYSIPEEIKLFKENTSNADINKINAVIMGSNTFKSIKCRPLKGRLNVVITRNKSQFHQIEDNLIFFASIDNAISYLKSLQNVQNIFICGGVSIYNYFIKNNLIDMLYISTLSVKEYSDYNVYLPNINLNNFTLTYTKIYENVLAKHVASKTQTTLDFTFNIYKKTDYIYYEYADS